MAIVIIDGELHETDPTVKAYIDSLEVKNKQLEGEIEVREWEMKEKDKLIAQLNDEITKYAHLESDQKVSDKICDRCGTHYEEGPLDVKSPHRYEITKFDSPYPCATTMELCGKCRQDFIRWLGEWRRNK